MKKRSTEAVPRFFVMLVMLLLSFFICPQRAVAGSVRSVSALCVVTSHQVSPHEMGAHVTTEAKAHVSWFISTLITQKERAVKAVSSSRMLKCMFEQTSQDKQKCLTVKHAEHPCSVFRNHTHFNTFYQRHHVIRTMHCPYQLRI